MKVFQNTRFRTLEFCENSKIYTISCELRKSLRIRRINLRLKNPHYALLTFPSRMSWRTAEEFLFAQRNWLQRKSLEFPSRIFLAQHFANGGKICLSPEIGERTVRIEQNKTIDRPSIHLGNQEIGIHLPVGQNEELIIKETCWKLARQFLPGWIEWAQMQCGLFPQRVRVGDQRTRWGSCSPKGTISLNWRIILLSKELGNYVVFHELAHLAEMNHSSKFWGKLEQFVANARLVDRELTQAGKPVFALGRTE